MTMILYVVASYMAMQLAGATGHWLDSYTPFALHCNWGDMLHITFILENKQFLLDNNNNFTIEFYKNGWFLHYSALQTGDANVFKYVDWLKESIQIDMHVHYNSFICMYRLMEVTMTKYLYRAPINIYRQLQVDLRKPCRKSIKWERSIADLNKYICTLDDQLTNFHYTVYQMYTTASNTIGSYIAINEKKIVFTITIERFDLNSAIVADVKNYLGYDKGELFCYLEITEKDMVTDDNYATMSYSDTERVTFSCDRYTDIAEDISVGLIDSRGDNIQTVIGTLYSELLDVSKNGSMLCCIYYEKTQSDGTQYINRVIANKTLLVCKKIEFNQTETMDEDRSLATMERMVQTFTNYVYLIIPIAVLLTITIITTYICIRKKTNETEIATERSICENQDVNYATLDLKTSGKKPTQPDEPQYAQIMAASKL